MCDGVSQVFFGGRRIQDEPPVADLHQPRVFGVVAVPLGEAGVFGGEAKLLNLFFCGLQDLGFFGFKVGGADFLTIPVKVGLDERPVLGDNLKPRRRGVGINKLLNVSGVFGFFIASWIVILSA